MARPLRLAAFLLAAGLAPAFAAPPTVSTETATNLHGTSAQLNGIANPNGVATQGWFVLSPSPIDGGAMTGFGGCDTTWSSSVAAQGIVVNVGSTNPAAFSATVTGLTAGHRYYYCAEAGNANGRARGAELSFYTPEPPLVSTSAPVGVTQAAATLKGSIYTNGAATTGWFRYSTTFPGSCTDAFGTRAPAAGGVALAAATPDTYPFSTPYGVDISGLAPSTTYYYCALGSNSEGVRTGSVQSFTTPATVDAITLPAELVTSTSARLVGQVNPKGVTTKGFFRYDTTNPGVCDSGFGSRAPFVDFDDVYLNPVNANQEFRVTATGLAPGTTYYYCAIADRFGAPPNSGRTYGAILEFTTPAAAPTTTTLPATSVLAESATMNGQGTPNGSLAFGYFRWGTSDPGTCSDAFGTRSPDSDAADAALGAGASPVDLSRPLAGLAPGSTYYYCAVARNSIGTTFGPVVPFTTAPLAPTVATAAASAVTESGATLNGSANPGAGATRGWFRYSNTSPGTCDDTFGTRAPAADGADLGAGTSAVPFSQALAGLAQGTTYYYCAIAQNASGLAVGPVQSFTTLVSVPGVSLSAPSLAFGGQSMGTTSPAMPVTVTNTGDASLTVSNVSIDNAQFTQTNNCTTVAPAASCTVNVSFSPSVAAGALNAVSTATGNLSITGNAAGSPHVVTLSGTGEKSLITHYYRSILRRAPDGGGKSYWQGEAQRLKDLGANVNETWFAMAQFFYFSAEYTALNRDNAGYVTDLYVTFFNRAPDAGGLSFWNGLLGQGMPREVVLAAFMFSTEFVTFTQNIFGNTAARAEIDVVMDFYRGLLARTPDQGGFGNWVTQFRAAQCAGAGAVSAKVEDISSNFANGGEYVARNRTNAQFVGDLYNSFLRRGGDLAGVQYWIGKLDTTALTRDGVRQQFIASSEFQGRVANVVSQGCLP